jgi:hypothetical protein
LRFIIIAVCRYDVPIMISNRTKKGAAESADEW